MAINTVIKSSPVMAILALSHGLSLAFSIMSVEPMSHSLSANVNSPIVVTFDEPVDPLSVDSVSFSLFGHWSGVPKGVREFEEGNTRLRFTPLTKFNAGEWVMVTISRNLVAESGDSLENGYCWQFWIKPSAGNVELQEINRIPVRRNGESHIQTYGAHGADLNEDGFSDFFVPNENTNDCRVFLNDGSGLYGEFQVYPIESGSRPSTNESADFNHDGHLDIAVGNSTNDKVTVFLGNGLGGFLSIENYQADSGVRGLAVADLNGDGYHDIITANRTGSTVATLINNGDGSFGSRKLIETNSNNETACATADANNDGIPDLFVGAFGSHEIVLLLGNGDGGFTFSSKVNAGGNGPWMIAVGDLNNDGNVDAATVNAQSSNVGIAFGDGNGGLSEAVTYSTGGFPIAIDFGDIDGDGDLDLMTSNFNGENWTYWENDGTGTMVNRQSLAASSAGSCATFHDRDNDGDLDMTGIDELDDLIFLFENTGISATSDPEPNITFSLQATPNPFSMFTSISFTIPDSLNSPDLNLIVTDLKGRLIHRFANELFTTASNRIQYNASSLPPGTYHCTLQHGLFQESTLLIKVQ